LIGLGVLALDKTEQKSGPPNRASPRQEVAQINVQTTGRYNKPIGAPLAMVAKSATPNTQQ
jgi:hypothetical protein